jgi:hypothetical protein
MLNNNFSYDKDPFFREWEKQLKDVSFILDFLHTYPNVLNQLNIEEVLTSYELFNSQKDWVRLYSKYEGMEKEFFKPYWVPIQKSSFDYFIDLSDPNYPIFEISFVFFEPYSYERMNLFNSISKVMLLGDSDVNIEGISTDFKDKWFEFYCDKIYNKK